MAEMFRRKPGATGGVMVAPTAGSGPKVNGLTSPGKPVNVAQAAPPPDQNPSRSPPSTTTFAGNVFSTFAASTCSGNSATTVYDPGTAAGRKIIKLIPPPVLPAPIPANVLHEVNSHEPGGTTK